MRWNNTAQMLRTALRVLAATTTLTLSINAHAGVYKCLDDDGGTVYQDRPCSGELLPATQMPATANTEPLAAETAPAPTPKTTPLPSDHPGSFFFWHAQSAAGTVYLLGSVHFGRQDMYPLPEAVMNAFDSAPTLVVEADLGALDPMQAGAMLADKAMYTDGNNLQSELDATTWQRLTQASGKLGLPAQLLNMQKPWMAAMTLTALAVKQIGYSETLGIDMYFLNRARGKKKVVELEGLAWQANLMANLSNGEQILMLADAIRMVEEGNAYFGRMIDAWQRGDTVELNAMMNESMGNSPAAAALSKKILTDRNATMASKIHSLASPGTPLFVVVGAAHMIGEQGLVAHLRRQGYTVDQL